MVASYPGPPFSECLGSRLIQQEGPGSDVRLMVVTHSSTGTIPSGTHASCLEGRGGEGSYRTH